MIVHAEVNALIFAKGDIEGCTLYNWPFMACSRCAAIMIQAGIRRHVAPVSTEERWLQSFGLAMSLFKEADVELVLGRSAVPSLGESS
jgi:dCMP deaminase